MRNSEISYAGVAKVIALYLWDSGLWPDTDQELPRRLRDRIARALRGEQLTSETLTWLTEAFGFDADDGHAVWRAFAGAGPSDGIAFTLRETVAPSKKPQRHRSVAIFNRYYINSERVLYRKETSHVVVALEDGVDTYTHNPRDNLDNIVVVTGGRLRSIEASAPGFLGVVFDLDPQLVKHQPSSLQYVSTYRPLSEPRTEVRRAARARAENVDMRVCFEGVQPTRAWWSVWDSYTGGRPVYSEEVNTTNLGELHHFVPYMEQTVVGFRWEW